jgi:hypothetical protein
VNQPGRIEVIRELCSFEGRGPGTDAERRAANMLAGRLRAIGRRVEIEPFFCHPQYALVHLIHAILAIAGSLLATVQPAVGFGLVLLVAVSTYLDLNTRLYLVRSLLFRRISQNVVSPGDRPDAPRRLILVAHYDAARTGYVFGRPLAWLNQRGDRVRLLLGPFRLFFWIGLAPLLPILGARMAGLDATWLSALQAIPTITLIVAAFLLIDVALSDIVPGAYDNASGVAAVLSAAQDLTADPPQNLDVWVVLTGSEESFCEGMRAFVKSHSKELDRDRTAIVNVDSVSYEQVRYEVSAGAVISVPFDRELVGICDALASADDRFGEPLAYSLFDDALPAQVRKLSSITITDGYRAPWYHRHEDTPDRINEDSLATATDFVIALARLLDREAGRGTTAQPAARAAV